MSILRCLVLAALVAAAFLAPRAARGQDLYDTSVLRTVNLQFHDANWLTLLRNNYVSETLILADLTIDGVTYPDVGVRIRGNTSYTALPAGSEKFSLKVKMDHVHPNQELMGYDTLNFNNGFRDPTFCREVVYNNFVAQFIPNPRANHVVVTLNGQNWGVYANIQQPDKRMLRDYFANADGVRIRCPNNPNGPGLSYAGTNPSSYSNYEIQSDGGLADPWPALIGVCNSLSNEPLASWQNIDALFAIDPSIWSVVLENLLTDDDSYINKGADFMTYRDPLDNRTHLLQRDANETFTQASWSVTRNFTATNKPVLSRVLAVPELRQRYMAHYRHTRQNLSWAYFEPIFTAHRNLIDAAVQADPKKLYSYTLFQNNFTTTVNMPIGGLGGGNIIGLQQFVTQRASFLNTQAELTAAGPTISSVQASELAPAPTEPVYITAAVAPAGSAIQKVELFYRPSASAGYLRVQMFDNGTSGDGAAGDGVFGALLPITAVPGQRVLYYVGAVASNTFSSASFLPRLAERGPLELVYGLSPSEGLYITEWMYSGANGEFIEFSNLSDTPVDMTGWSLDDDHAIAGAFDLSAFGIVQPGESVVVTETGAEAFRLAWGLAPSVKVIGELGVSSGNNYGRADQIHLYNALGELADRLAYGDQTFPGTIRTQNRSGQAPCEAVGQDNVALWVLSTAADSFGSWTSTSGDVGTPGAHIDCAICAADYDGNGEREVTDIFTFLTDWFAGVSAAYEFGGVPGVPAIFAFLTEWFAGCE
ncbi:MAG: CotH kinase family protein [Phycisphaeraceae bacterium]|nr:CotH kinase family protein [Phycisphaeraceae bacterium]MBX3406905.1 CotH kinase family protein [Phycisphaeraceae bacterium]